MPLQETSGAASYDAFGGGVPVEPNYIESVFSTFLYTGNGSTQTINNGIDLAGKGGMVWCKVRNTTSSNFLFDTARGANALFSNLTNGQQSEPQGITSFNANGFTLGTNGGTNGADNTFASWTFREQAKFFDVVTYTGTGSARTVAHNLGSVPGCIIVKRTDSAGFDWAVYHTSTGNTQRLLLNTTDPAGTSSSFWNNTTPTSTVFTVGSNVNTNASGGTYVAYLFAHNAGGFGLSGTDNVISCGSYTGNGSTTGPVIDLGYEPQWLLVKNASTAGDDWILVDNMRGFPVSGNTTYLNPNKSVAESNFPLVSPTATGFQPRTTDTGYNASGSTYIYIAIRRGPMRTPTTGTSVFSVAPNLNANPEFTSGFPVDAALMRRVTTTAENYFASRLTGTGYMFTESTSAEQTSSSFQWDYQNGWLENFYTGTSGVFSWNFRRAPGFFDVVCYTGTVPLDSTTPQTINHNLGVAPELIIFKSRSLSPNNWLVCYNINSSGYDRAFLNLDQSGATFTGYTAFRSFLASQPTATQLSLGSSGNTTSNVSNSGSTYVAYLFATCPGVSKVGSYTGTGTTQVINCGFTAGSRFVLIKRTDSTGDWYVWDSARGIVSGNDPYLLLNSTAAEVTNTDFIDTASTGFEISSAAPAAINASGGTFIFLAIA